MNTFHAPINSDLHVLWPFFKTNTLVYVNYVNNFILASQSFIHESMREPFKNQGGSPNESDLVF